jgi:hypothetical protein
VTVTGRLGYCPQRPSLVDLLRPDALRRPLEAAMLLLGGATTLVRARALRLRPHVPLREEDPGRV